MFCPSCGKELPEGVKFCPACGTGLAARGSAPEAAPVQEPIYTPPVQEPVYTPPVQQPQPVYQQPQQPVYGQSGFVAPGQPVYGQPVYAAQAQQPAQPAKKTWPGGAITFAILTFLFALGAYIAYYSEFSWLMGGGLIVQVLFSMLPYLLLLIFFVTPTRRVPVLTAIPITVMVVMNMITVLSMGDFAALAVPTMVQLGFDGLIFIFYLIQTLARPHNKALPVLITIFGIIAALVCSIMQIVSAVSGWMVAFNIIMAIGVIFWYTTHIIASYAIPPRS